jgi:hypothetical protein
MSKLRQTRAVGSRGFLVAVELRPEPGDLGLRGHQAFGQARRELGLVGQQPVVTPRDRAHQPEQTELQPAPPRRWRGEVALAVRDDHLLVGAELRGEVVEAVPDLGRLHAGARGALLGPVQLAGQVLEGVALLGLVGLRAHRGRA